MFSLYYVDFTSVLKGACMGEIYIARAPKQNFFVDTFKSSFYF